MSAINKTSDRKEKEREKEEKERRREVPRAHTSPIAPSIPF
jgi:hypothetical protein